MSPMSRPSPIELHVHFHNKTLHETDPWIACDIGDIGDIGGDVAT
jgi:hypothetical protein